MIKTLNLQIKKSLNILLNKITYSPSINPVLFASQVKELAQKLPSNIKESLIKDFKSQGYLLIKGLSDDSNPLQSPKNNRDHLGETTQLSLVQAILVSLFSHMISYEAEGEGYLFQDIVPSQEMTFEQSSLGSGKELEIHTEQAFSRLKPDILSLACLRGAEDAFTYLLPVQFLINRLDDKDIILLQQPLWMIGIDLSFKINGYEFIDGDIRGPWPILYKVGGCGGLEGGVKEEEEVGLEEEGGVKEGLEYSLLFDQNLMTGITPQAQELINKIVNIYYESRLSYSLVSGDILIIDNNKNVHGRSPFVANFNGNDRFLIRCFGTYDLKKSEYARGRGGGLMVSAIYS